MAEITKIDSHWNQTVEPSILDQYRDSDRWKGVLESVIKQIQTVEDDAFELSTILRFDDEAERPKGYKLDWFGSLVNVERIVGESDDEYFVRIKTTIVSDNAGTPDCIINLAGELSNSEYVVDGQTGIKVYKSIVFFEETAAVFFIYTPKGSQLLRRQVKNMSPAGVLGVPAAAMTDGEGNLIRDYDGNIMVAVAQDAAIGHK
ncbi:MAG: hypothetical protein MJY89_06085 [Bacteroidales bacterium]|nr:hypothetical protein [Bacteroidales bacterium]